MAHPQFNFTSNFSLTDIVTRSNLKELVLKHNQTIYGRYNPLVGAQIDIDLGMPVVSEDTPDLYQTITNSLAQFKIPIFVKSVQSSQTPGLTENFQFYPVGQIDPDADYVFIGYDGTHIVKALIHNDNTVTYDIDGSFVHRVSIYSDIVDGVYVQVPVDLDKFDPEHPFDSEIYKQTLNKWIANKEPVFLAIKYTGYDAVGWALQDQAFLFEDGSSNITFFIRKLSPRSSFLVYNLYTIVNNDHVAVEPVSDMAFQTEANMLSIVNTRNDRYPSCLAVKNAIAQARNLDVHFENSNMIDAQNHSHYTIQCDYPSLVILITTENGTAPAEFAAEIYCKTQCTVSVLINGMVAYPSVAGGTEMEGDKLYQLTCVGSCWTLAEFTPSDQVYIGGTAHKCVRVGTKLWLAHNLDYAWSELTVGDNDISYSRQLANYYNNDSTTHGAAGDKYGLLYNFAATEYLQMHKDTLLPPGWRLPTTEEIEALAQIVGGLSVAGRELKSPDGWTSGTGLGDFEINIVPGGQYDGSFSNLGSQGILWTASADGITYSCDTGDAMTIASTDKITGCSIRLVKDLL